MRHENADSQNDLFHFERLAWQQGHTRVVGVDEAGRGPLAGPVVAAAVVLPGTSCPLPVADSKALSPAEREFLAAELRQLPGIQIGVGLASPAEIDRINILQATHAAMRSAVRQLDPAPEFALVDGRPVPDFPVRAEFVVRGDARSASVAAASIIAKVHRDHLMAELDAKYPGYGFAQHKGYCTPAHLEALGRLGPTPVHRRSFAPVREAGPARRVQMEFAFNDAPSAPKAGD